MKGKASPVHTALPESSAASQGLGEGTSDVRPVCGDRGGVQDRGLLEQEGRWGPQESRTEFGGYFDVLAKVN